MSSINQLRNNHYRYKTRLNTAKGNLKNRINTLKREGKASNNIKSNNTVRQLLRHHKHYKSLVQQYGDLITQKEKAEFEQLERDANNAVQKINEPNNISTELRAQLNQFAAHKKQVDKVSNILAGKGTRKRRNRQRNRRGQQNRVTHNSNKQNANNSCRQRGINGACILGGIGAGAAIGGVPGACVGGVCGAAAAVGRRFMGGKTRKRKRRGKKRTRKKYKR